MPPRWDFYWANVAGKDASISVDLSLRDAAPLRDRPHFLRVRIRLRAPNESGWPTREERPTLDAFEDALVERLGAEDAVHAGRMFRDGLCEQYFYAPRPLEALDAAVGEVFAGFPDYEGESDGWEDAAWEAYLENLYPNEMGLLFMRTRERVELLGEAGVDLEAAEEVHHRIDVPEASRPAFEAAARARGFSPAPEGVSRAEPLRFGALNATVERLFVLAKEHGGEYRDWTAPRLEETLGLARQRRLDAALFDRLVELGYDFRKPHTLDHRFYAEGEADARALAAELGRRGYRVQLARDGEEGDWILDVHKTARLDFEAVSAETAGLWRLARAHRATYDGWGTGKE